MTTRKRTPLAERRREAKEQRERQARATQVDKLVVTEDIDPAALLASTKLIIHTEIQRMAKLQATPEGIITANDAKKLQQMISTIGQMLRIKEQTAPDLTSLSDEELEALANTPTEASGGR